MTKRHVLSNYLISNVRPRVYTGTSSWNGRRWLYQQWRFGQIYFERDKTRCLKKCTCTAWPRTYFQRVLKTKKKICITSQQNGSKVNWAKASDAAREWGDDPHNTYNILVRNSVIIMHLNGRSGTFVMTCVDGKSENGSCRILYRKEFSRRCRHI